MFLTGVNEKISKNMPNSRRVSVSGTVYRSIRATARAYGITPMAVIYRLKNWSDWNYVD